MFQAQFKSSSKSEMCQKGTKSSHTPPPKKSITSEGEIPLVSWPRRQREPRGQFYFQSTCPQTPPAAPGRGRGRGRGAEEAAAAARCPGGSSRYRRSPAPRARLRLRLSPARCLRLPPPRIGSRYAGKRRGGRSSSSGSARLGSAFLPGFSLSLPSAASLLPGEQSLSPASNSSARLGSAQLPVPMPRCPAAAPPLLRAAAAAASPGFASALSVRSGAAQPRPQSRGRLDTLSL